MKNLILITLLFTTQSWAQLEANSLFKKQGKKIITEFSTTTYQSTHDLLYYIPDSVDLTKPTSVVVYLHGGNSNMTQERATGTADTLFWGTVDGLFSKKSGIKSIAEDLGFIVVMPTTTKGWNEYTPAYMEDVLKMIRKELNPDPNKIFLMGHSMGAMGICRSVSALADEFAMFLPMSGGFQPHLKTHAFTGPLFNTNVWVTVGVKYDFEDFKKWNQNFETFLNSTYVTDFFKTSKLESFQFEIHNGTHNPNIPVIEERLEKFTKDVQRDVYQPNLFGTVNDSKSGLNKRYFWFDGKEFRQRDTLENGIFMNFRLFTKNNEITLYLDRPTKYLYDTRAHLKTARLHLSEKIVNLDRPIKVNLITKRGVAEEMSVLFEGKVERNNAESKKLIQETYDTALIYDAYLDLPLPRN
jgi:hypothetical protein